MNRVGVRQNIDLLVFISLFSLLSSQFAVVDQAAWGGGGGAREHKIYIATFDDYLFMA